MNQTINKMDLTLIKSDLFFYNDLNYFKVMAKFEVIKGVMHVLHSGAVEEVVIFDMFGSMVLKKNETVFFIDHLPAGTYSINIKTDKGVTHGRFSI